jgi:hypothetical protein
MVDAISSATRTDPNQDLDPDRSTQPATRVVVPPPQPPDLPDVTAFIQNAVKAATGQLAAPSPAPHSMLAMGVKAADVETITRDTAIQQKLDAFLESAKPTFHTPDGDVSVAIPFRMKPEDEASFLAHTDNDSRPYVEQERTALSNSGELTRVAAKLGLSGRALGDLASGRGTPDNIRRVTQDLIYAGRLPPGPGDVGSRIRIMMCNYGIGLDCAGYVQQAFLASRGVSRSQAGFGPATDEDLSHLSARGFKSVPQSDARAGDLFILKPPANQKVGHTVMIRDVRQADPTEAAGLAALGEPAWGRPDPSAIQRFELDSSWGNWADPQRGGAKRETLYYNTAARLWAYPDGNRWIIESTPYLQHPIDGIYRPAQEP